MFLLILQIKLLQKVNFFEKKKKKKKKINQAVQELEINFFFVN